MDYEFILLFLPWCYDNFRRYINLQFTTQIVLRLTRYSGWIVEFLIKVRDGNLKEVGYVPAGAYGGICLGRLLLAEPTHRYGERRMLLIYTIISLALQLVFWLVPDMISSIVVFSIMGFFLGPFFAAVSSSEKRPSTTRHIADS